MASVEKCTTIHSNPAFTLEEKRSKVQFSNPQRLEIHEIRVDGCVITQQTSCDYLVNIPDKDASLFVELKGSRVADAFKQLEQSHIALREHRKRTVFWIVSSQRCPLTSTEITNERLKLRKTLNIRLHIKNSPVLWNIEKPSQSSLG